VEIEVTRAGENYVEIKVKGEEHTLGNLIANYLMRLPGVKFASYSMPHPLINEILIRVMTDGSISPYEAFRKAAEEALKDLDRFEEELEKV
jgi:DNA-directed RNA polymerase, subunit L (EC 2.7.7.6)